MDKLISLQMASNILSVSKWYIRRLPENVLPVYKTKGMHRRYKLSDVNKLIGLEDSTTDSVAVYVRVSSHEQKQKGDLDRQKVRVLEYCMSKKYRVSHIIDEVSSGMNDNRIKFNKLIELSLNKQINKIVVEHKDRLTRFNFKTFKEFFKCLGVDVEVVEDTLPKSYEEELVEDIISIMSSFSAKIYGKRNSENKKRLVKWKFIDPTR